MRYHLILVTSALVATAAPAAAQAAGEPTMPLADVRAGMHCTARSVVRGTEIATFDADVVDIVQGDRGAGQPYILVRVSGPAVDRTGIGPGFSGSPIACPDAAGTPRIIGAISEGLGEYGNKTALATPIEAILGEPLTPPAETRRAPGLLRSARPLATPLSVGGLSPAVARLVERAATRAHRVVYATPARPRADVFPPQSLVPGAAMSVGLAGGDFTAGAIGTVAYADGDTVWGFGHPLDAAGRRALLLQDAYVYDVIDNPVASADLQTYKYAAAGHDLGTLSNDGVSAVVGRLGTLPDRFPLKIIATDLDNHRTRVANVTVADEAGVGLPTGISSLAQIGSIALSQMAYLTLDGLPLRQSGSMCVRFNLREYPKPMRFCNRYVGGTGGGDEGGGGPPVADFGNAVAELDAFNFGPLHLTGVEVNLRLRRSLRLAYLLNIVRAPDVVRRGSTFSATIRVRRQNGPAATRKIRVHVPRAMPAGERTLTLTGTSSDGVQSLASAADALTAVLDLSGGEEDTQDEAGVRTLKGLARRIADVHRDDALFASFPEPGQDPSGDGSGTPASGPEAVAQKPRIVLEDPELRIAGTAKRRILVVP